MSDLEKELEDLQLQLASRNRKINELIEQDSNLQKTLNNGLTTEDESQ